MRQASLSIVLCTYNGSAFLPAQLASLLAQSRRPERIVISDDGSTDDSWARLRHFAAEAERVGIQVLLIRQPRNLGFVANFSAALAQAGAELVFLCDQDDVWHAEKLAVMAEAMEDDPGLQLAHCNARRVDAQGLPLEGDLYHALRLEPAELQRIAAGEAFRVYARRNLATGAATVVRGSLLQQALPVPPDWLHDEWLAVCASALGQVSVMPQVLLDYRQHGANQLGMRRRSWLDMWRHVFEPVGNLLARQQRRLRLLQQWLEQAALAEPDRMRHLQLLREMQSHVSTRLALPAPRLLRLPAVLCELRRGGYHGCATGWRTVLHDLLRRAGPEVER